MSELERQFKEVQGKVAELLDAPSGYKFPTGRIQQKYELLREMFGLPGSSINPDFPSNVLEHWVKLAPLSFMRQWPIVYHALKIMGNNTGTEVALLARLLAWSYIELFSGLANTEGDLPGGPILKLTAVELGLSPDLDFNDIYNAINVHAVLIPDLVLKRSESAVSAGIAKVESTQVNIENRIQQWEHQLNITENRVKESESKLNAYEKSLEKYKETFNFLGLSSAFSKFFERKQSEKTYLFYSLVVISVAILILPFLAHWMITFPLDFKPSGFFDPILWKEATKYTPFIALELLLIYFFRVVLTHFNSTQAQILQLEIRLAACSFIEDYVRFAKESGNHDLSKFESLIFGGIVADLDKVPGTFDGLDQLVKVIKDIKGN